MLPPSTTYGPKKRAHYPPVETHKASTHMSKLSMYWGASLPLSEAKELASEDVLAIPTPDPWSLRRTLGGEGPVNRWMHLPISPVYFPVTAWLSAPCSPPTKWKEEVHGSLRLPTTAATIQAGAGDDVNSYNPIKKSQQSCHISHFNFFLALILDIYIATISLWG